MRRASFSVVGRLKSVWYAIVGVGFLIRTQHSTWFHLATTVLLVLLGLWLRLSLNDWRWIVVAVSFVWVAEAVNTAVEHVCDAVTLAYRPVIKHAKDVAAGAVLFSWVGAFGIVALTFWPYLTHRS